MYYKVLYPLPDGALISTFLYHPYPKHGAVHGQEIYAFLNPADALAYARTETTDYHYYTGTGLPAAVYAVNGTQQLRKPWHFGTVHCDIAVLNDVTVLGPFTGNDHQ